MERVNYLAFALPAFFIFVYIEFEVAKRKKLDKIFNYESSINNISIGIAERLLSLFITSSFYMLFYYVYENYALFYIPNGWCTWIALILATDLVWYWYHRLGHQVNFFWAAHLVHHQSEEFNLTVAARITVFQALIRNLFWCLLPWVGFHPSLVIFILLFHGVYSFFTHTQVVGKLGWFEHIFITPSLHGVHHASNEKYLDKNYGDIFVFWDKLFGTFQKEEEKPIYGLTNPIKSYRFLWQHFHYYLEIWEAASRVDSIKEKLKIVFGSPKLIDENIRSELEEKWLNLTATSSGDLGSKIYLNAQIAFSFLLTCMMTFWLEELTIVDRIFGASFIIITLIICGDLLERKRTILLEYLRGVLLVVYCVWKLVPDPSHSFVA